MSESSVLSSSPKLRGPCSESVPSSKFLDTDVSIISSKVSIRTTGDVAVLLIHFGLTVDTHRHSWEVLAKLLAHPDCRDIICDVGMSVIKSIAIEVLEG
jgi:hypothetical protein